MKRKRLTKEAIDPAVHVQRECRKRGRVWGKRHSSTAAARTHWSKAVFLDYLSNHRSVGDGIYITVTPQLENG